MIFNSSNFLIFFPVVFLFYYFLPFKPRKIFLLLSGFIFYSFYFPLYLVVLLYVIIVSYFFGRIIASYQNQAKKYLLLGILLNLVVILLFKYYNFLSYNISGFAKLIHWNYSIALLEVLVPVGISFYVFKAISYLIESYRKSIEPEKNIINVALYISYFPELLAGPIDKPQNLIPQFKINQEFEYEKVSDGFKIMTWGFFKKLVIADRLSALVNQVFNNPDYYEGISLVIAVLFFSMQIYCDFSGYSDIAYGISLALGFKIVQNFNKPYFATSISDFWTKWHISLSIWLRDYVFLPIAYTTSRGYQNLKIKKYFKIDILSYCTAALFTMLICGLWHGASWGFILWGISYGLLLIISLLTKKIRKRTVKFFKIAKFPLFYKIFRIVTIFILVNILWILFRANSLSEAITIYNNIFLGWNSFFIGLTNFAYMRSIFGTLGVTEFEFYLSIFGICILIIIEIIQLKYNIIELLRSKNAIFRWTLYYAVLIIIIFYGAFNSSQGFIYMQF